MELHRRIQADLNKGEARNALARACFNCLGELRDRTQNQQHRTNGLSLVVAAIVLWKTVYPAKAIQKLKRLSGNLSEVLPHLSRLGWQHINLTGAMSSG
jgi:TnpA family transposase